MLKAVKVFTEKKYQDHIPCSFSYKVVCIGDRFSKAIIVYRGENTAYEFLKAILKGYKYCNKVMNKHFNKIWSWLKKKRIYFKEVTVVRFVKNLLVMMKKKLEIIVT